MTVKYVKEKEKKAVLPAHMDRNLFCDWQEGRLKGREEIDLLEHIGACTFCAERFGTWMEEGFAQEMETDGNFPKEMMSEENSLEEVQPEKNFLTEPPGYLKEEILERTRQMDVRAAVKLKETSKQVQLMIYSLKVGLAVAASIFLLTITTDIQRMNLEVPESQRTQELQERQEAAVKRQESRAKEEDFTGKLRRGSREITNILNNLSSGLFGIETDNSGTEKNQEVTR